MNTRRKFNSILAAAVLAAFPVLDAAHSEVAASKRSVLSDEDRALAVAADELQRYWSEITGNKEKAPVRFAVDPSISKSGNDAYEMKTDGALLRLTGSNARSVLYALYDFLERRAGCGWFWDGDVVPKRKNIDISGLDVHEESKFEYRGIRYFAHRGLTRFQAEHWGMDDWRREIDWLIKKRFNLFMLRIGQDDLFQKAFPDVCAYPDASKPLPGALKLFDNRSLFWPLEFRGKLRKELMDYAFARGLMAPEDFGTMTHWYSRTPQDFLDKMKPDFLPQAQTTYGEPSGLVWDIRKKKWMDAYWKITDAAVREYGRPDLLHTIGIAERRVSTNRAENLASKIEWTNMLLDGAKKRYPQAVRLLAGWDLYCMRKPDEVKSFLKHIPEDVVIWDYEADSYINTNFSEWDVIGKRPYVFGVFMAYEAALDMRTDYTKIIARQRLVADDPMCKGYILWPESSHVDSLGLEWVARNAWRVDRPDVEPVVEDYCRRRYPGDTEAMKRIWLDTIPVSTNMQHLWRWNAYLPILREMGEGHIVAKSSWQWPQPKPDAAFAGLGSVCERLKMLDWEKSEMLKRDMTDVARVWADRIAIESENRFLSAYFRWMKGDAQAAQKLDCLAKNAIDSLKVLAEILALHTDFSVCDTYRRMDEVCHIANPDFGRVLIDNAANYYCASHQAELAEHCYIPAFEAFARHIMEKVAADDRSPPDAGVIKAVRDRTLDIPLESMRSSKPRTRAGFNSALDRIRLR